MTLKEELEQQLAKFKQRASAELAATLQAGVDELNESGIVERAVRQGDIAPQFKLPNAKGDIVVLSDLLAEGPVVLAFYRGGWCPYCNLQLRAYQRVLPAIRELGAQLVAISPQAPDESLTTAEKNALEFEVLSDVGARVADAYRILFDLSDQLKAAYLGMGRDLSADNADGQWHLPIPATYVIGRDARIALAYIDPEYRNRLEPSQILDALKKLSVAETLAP